jgi:hypothetical protein
MADEEKKDATAPAMRQDASTGQMVEDPNAAAAPTDPKKPTMAIKVYAPFKIYYEGEGYSITAENETGPFDILPHHHNFLCMLVPCDLIIKTPYEVKTVRISRALMHVKAEKVTVFVDV